MSAQGCQHIVHSTRSGPCTGTKLAMIFSGKCLLSSLELLLLLAIASYYIDANLDVFSGLCISSSKGKFDDRVSVSSLVLLIVTVV